jgi:tol-pal system protein YbgF
VILLVQKAVKVRFSRGRDMIRFSKSKFACVLLLGTVLATPVFAQSASDTNMRLNQMEEQMRTLVGQVEQLTFTVKQLQGQIASSRKMGEAAPAPAAQPLQQPLQETAEQPAPVAKKPIMKQASAENAPVDGGGIEQIEDVAQAPIANDTADNGAAPVRKAPTAKMLGALGTSKPAAEPNDGGFQGQVLVAPGDGQAQANAQNENGSVETVALASETPEGLYERSNESLLRRQFSEAEQGFRTFIEKYPDHNLAGSAQYWLGETYYAQGQFKDAAKNFLSGYQQFPKSRRAPDSLLKLGMALNKLGQNQQACASLGAVGQQFPNAVDAKRRAQAEFRRAGC